MSLERMLKCTHTPKLHVFFVLRPNRAIGRLTLIHKRKLFQFVAKAATCIPGVPHSLWNVRLDHLLVVSVGPILV